jgi:hypothetical protein
MDTPRCSDDAIIKKYTDAGWIAFCPPKGINNVIAFKPGRMHFIKIVRSVDDGVGIPKNTFIQNAFSNSADPIYAVVGPKSAAIKLVNINLNTRVVLAARKKTIEVIL